MKITAGIIIILVCAFVALALGSAAIVITGKDPTSYVGSVGILLTAVAAFIVSIRGQQKQTEKIEVVRKQTNGTLTKLLVEKYLAEEQARQALAKLHPTEAQEILDMTHNRDDLLKIIQERNTDVNHKLSAS